MSKPKKSKAPDRAYLVEFVTGELVIHASTVRAPTALMAVAIALLRKVPHKLRPECSNGRARLMRD